MSDLKQQPWWRRGVTITPGAATLVGIALGSAVGGLIAVQWLDRMAFVLGLFMAFQGGVWGYVIWLTNDRARGERFHGMASKVAVFAVASLLLAFPDFWGQMWRDNRLLSVCLFGAICGISMLVVGTGWGLIHLVGSLRVRLRGASKASLTCSTGGIWDRELDQPLPSAKRIG